MEQLQLLLGLVCGLLVLVCLGVGLSPERSGHLHLGHLKLDNERGAVILAHLLLQVLLAFVVADIGL